MGSAEVHQPICHEESSCLQCNSSSPRKQQMDTLVTTLFTRASPCLWSTFTCSLEYRQLRVLQLVRKCCKGDVQLYLSSVSSSFRLLIKDQSKRVRINLSYGWAGQSAAAVTFSLSVCLAVQCLEPGKANGQYEHSCNPSTWSLKRDKPMHFLQFYLIKKILPMISLWK